MDFFSTIFLKRPFKLIYQKNFRPEFSIQAEIRIIRQPNNRLSGSINSGLNEKRNWHLFSK